MSYVGNYGSLGASEPTYYVYIQKWYSTSSGSGPSIKAKKKDGPPIRKGPFNRAEAVVKKDSANIGPAGWRQYNGPKDHYYHWTTAKLGPGPTSAAPGTPPAPRTPRTGTTVDSGLPGVPDAPVANGKPSGPAPGASTGPAEAETENVAMTAQGPAMATPGGQLVAHPGEAGFPVKTALMIGGGLLVAYFVFGRKRR